jgi:RNA polymerase-binding transcription factor
MDASYLRKLRAELNRRKSELLAQITRTELQVRAAAERPTDPGDQSAETVNREFMFSQSDANRQSLRRVQEALDRIREGTFGECEECGSEINSARLKAIPWARNCVRCQEKLETARELLAA